jgi:hypothetical protein
MLFKNFCRGALALGAVMMTQAVVLNFAKADGPTPSDAGGWIADPSIVGELQPAQQFGKFSVQVPAGFVEQKPSVKTTAGGTETMYKFDGPKRPDHTYAVLLIYVMTPSGDSKVSDVNLTNPTPQWVQGIHFWGQSSGTVNGLPAVHQLWQYRLNGQKPVRTGTEYTANDGTSTVTVAGIDYILHVNDSLPLFTASALSLHE